MTNSTPQDTDPQLLHAALKRSGFPFQTSVAMALAKTPRWELLDTEIPWTDPDGEDQFIDALGEADSTLAVVECKKMDKAALIFLRPTGSGLTRLDGKVILACTVQDFQKPNLETFCAMFRITPELAAHQLCVVAGHDGRLLEKDLGPLVHATNWVARKDRNLLMSDLVQRGEDSIRTHTVYLPILVTNAALYTTEYHPEEVSLDTASFEQHPSVTPVPWVALTKAFSSNDQLDSDERTAFIVSANKLREFLTGARVEPRPELHDPPKRPKKRTGWRRQ